MTIIVLRVTLALGLLVAPLSAAQRAQLDPRLEQSAREGERLSAVDYVAAEAARATYAADVDAFFTSVDLFVTPTMPQVAPRIDLAALPPPPRATPLACRGIRPSACPVA